MQRNKFYLFLYASSSRILFDFVGKIMLSEVIALIFLIFTNFRKQIKENNELKLVLKGLFFLLVAQILSDLINNSSPSDFLRGWAVILFAMISMIYLVINISKDIKNIIYFLIGIMLVNLFFGPGSLDSTTLEYDTNYFKVRYVIFLDPALLLFSYFLFLKNKKRIACLLILISGLLYLSLDARSQGIIYIISAIIIYLKVAGIKLTKSNILIIFLLSTTFLYIGYVIYVDLVLNHGFGGSNAFSQLQKTSNPYNPFSLLFYGRGEVVILFLASIDKPIFGFGSWGHDPNGYYANLLANLLENNYVSDSGIIPAHSILLGYWAYAGALGLLSIIFLFYRLFYYAFKVYHSNYHTSTLPILVILSIGMAWHLLFSPIGYLRTGFPLFASFIIVEYSHLKKLK